jgi:hypothetical protein
VQGVIWLLCPRWMICLWMWTLPLAMPIRFALEIATSVMSQLVRLACHSGERAGLA